jgi:hypothetical protein
MKGAYCLSCREAGPDLVFTSEELGRLPDGIVGRIRFTCVRCQQRWVWTVRHRGAVLEYVVIGPERATAIDVTHERQ